MYGRKKIWSMKDITKTFILNPDIYSIKLILVNSCSPMYYLGM